MLNQCFKLIKIGMSFSPEVAISHDCMRYPKRSGNYMIDPEVKVEEHHWSDDLGTEVYTIALRYRTQYSHPKVFRTTLRYSKIREYYEYISSKFPEIVKTVVAPFPPKRYVFYTYEGIAEERFRMMNDFFEHLSIYVFLFELDQFTSMFSHK